MTTKVTVETAEWPVRVGSFPLDDDRKCVADGEWSVVGEIPPHSSETFYVHRHIDLIVQELPSDAEKAAALQAD